MPRLTGHLLAFSSGDRFQLCALSRHARSVFSWPACVLLPEDLEEPKGFAEKIAMALTAFCAAEGGELKAGGGREKTAIVPLSSPCTYLAESSLVLFCSIELQEIQTFCRE